jgi:putative Mn2+ efflux pump MntP
VRGYLILVGLWMLYESMSHTEHALLDPEGVLRVVLAVVVAGVIAVASAIIAWLAAKCGFPP